tara:strand:- start:67 stop:909 length:843 start_codon:yes stop_codon:yes gene_type:complete
MIRKEMSNKSLFEIFKNTKYFSLKYKNYFTIYDKLLSYYRGKKITFVEIGVLSGGSLQMWKEYFGNDARIIGIDLNPDAKRLESEGFEIFIGNQTDPNFWSSFFEKVGKVDVILDDGGHTNFQQIMTAVSVIPNINDDGTLIVEDVFHSYGVSYGEVGFFNPSKYSFINFCKKTIDDINYRFPETKKFKFSLNKYVYSLEIFESIVAFKINSVLCKSVNSVVYNNGKNFNAKDFAHIHDPKVPGSNKFVVFIKKLYPRFRGTLKYFVFKINESFLKKFFK